MSKARWTIEQMKQAKRIEVDGVFVKAETQVAKNPIKFKPIDESAYIGGIDPYNLILPDGDIERLAGAEMFKSFKETGYIFVKAPEWDTIELPGGETIEVKHRFEINPCPAPRMTKRDKWLMPRRACVQRYFDWREAFTHLCKINGYTLQETLRVLFIVPLPKYLSKAKKQARLGQSHKQRPDTDNLMKSVKDSFDADDGFVWDERGVKIWGEKGEIIIF